MRTDTPRSGSRQGIPVVARPDDLLVVDAQDHPIQVLKQTKNVCSNLFPLCRLCNYVYWTFCRLFNTSTLYSTVLFNSIFFLRNIGHPCKFLRQYVNDAKVKRVSHCQAVRRSSIENREIQDFFLFFLLNSVFTTLYVSYILESTSAGSSCSRSFLKLLTYQTSRSLPKYHLSLSLMISPSFC